MGDAMWTGMDRCVVGEVGEAVFGITHTRFNTLYSKQELVREKFI